MESFVKYINSKRKSLQKSETKKARHFFKVALYNFIYKTKIILFLQFLPID